VQYSQTETVIFVGHSLFFKKFYSEHISDELKSKNPDLAFQMSKYKLDNAGLLGVTVEFPENGSRPTIVDCEIMFGSRFDDHSTSLSQKHPSQKH
jgi:hypothetical protein